MSQVRCNLRKMPEDVRYFLKSGQYFILIFTVSAIYIFADIILYQSYFT